MNNTAKTLQILRDLLGQSFYLFHAVKLTDKSYILEKHKQELMYIFSTDNWQKLKGKLIELGDKYRKQLDK